MNDIIYSGKELLFHYTSFESALNIISSNTLLFGRFEDMNDIAERSRLVYSMDNSDKLIKEISRYQGISLTEDNKSLRGFAIDSMWGYYGVKGNGCCLVLDKEKLIKAYLKLVKKLPIKRKRLNVVYKDNCSNTIFGIKVIHGNYRDSIKKALDAIFYIKDSSWQNEREVRLLIRSMSQSRRKLPLQDSLKGAILCLPQEQNFNKSVSYEIIRKVSNCPIYHYTTNLGNKELRLGNTLIWPKQGKDWDFTD